MIGKKLNSRPNRCLDRTTLNEIFLLLYRSKILRDKYIAKATLRLSQNPSAICIWHDIPGIAEVLAIALHSDAAINNFMHGFEDAAQAKACLGEIARAFLNTLERCHIAKLISNTLYHFARIASKDLIQNENLSMLPNLINKLFNSQDKFIREGAKTRAYDAIFACAALAKHNRTDITNALIQQVLHYYAHGNKPAYERAFFFKKISMLFEHLTSLQTQDNGTHITIDNAFLRAVIDESNAKTGKPAAQFEEHFTNTLHCYNQLERLGCLNSVEQDTKKQFLDAFFSVPFDPDPTISRTGFASKLANCLAQLCSRGNTLSDLTKRQLKTHLQSAQIELETNSLQLSDAQNIFVYHLLYDLTYLSNQEEKLQQILLSTALPTLSQGVQALTEASKAEKARYETKFMLLMMSIQSLLSSNSLPHNGTAYFHHLPTLLDWLYFVAPLNSLPVTTQIMLLHTFASLVQGGYLHKDSMHIKVLDLHRSILQSNRVEYLQQLPNFHISMVIAESIYFAPAQTPQPAYPGPPIGGGAATQHPIMTYPWSTPPPEETKGSQWGQAPKPNHY